MKKRISFLTLFTLAGAAVLFVSALMLVTSQYRSRSIVAQLDRLQNESKRLNDDASELYMEISRAALPSYIGAKASRMGLSTATGRNTVVLEYRPLGLQKKEGGR